MTWGISRPWASGKRGWAKVEYRLVCKQYGIPFEQGNEWINTVRMMLNDEDCVLDAAENLSGLPAESHEGFEMVPAVSGK